MNPYLMAVISVVRRKRKCAKCGREQVVPISKKKDTVACKFCGAEIPPNK